MVSVAQGWVFRGAARRLARAGEEGRERGRAQGPARSREGPALTQDGEGWSGVLGERG